MAFEERFILGFADTDTGEFIPARSTPSGAALVSPGSAGGASAVQTLLDAVAATGAGSTFEGTGYTTFQAFSDASHTGTSTIDVEVSLDGSHWIVAGTISVTGNSDTDGFALDAPWAFVRGNVTAHGDSTNGVSLLMGK